MTAVRHPLVKLARGLALAAPLAALAPAAAHAQPRPGVTTRADVMAKMGEPDMTFITEALEGEVILVPTPGDPWTIDRAFRRADADPDGREVVRYEVLQYWDGPTGTSRSSFVFPKDGERLLYAVVKPSPSEDTVEEAKARYGREPRIERREYEEGHLLFSTVHLAFPEDGVELVIETRDLRVSRKLFVHRDAKGHAAMP